MLNYRACKLCAVLAAAWGLVLAGGCGSKASTCKKACAMIASCYGIEITSDAGSADWVCPLSDECAKSDLEYCQAKCINASSCAAILGEEAEAAAKLQECQLACAVAAADSAVSADIGPGRDSGATADRSRADVSISCMPSCAGRQCGDDGCGGSCGTCYSPDTCSAYGLCTCEPSCAGRECGDDGCGGSCGTCYSPDTCSAYGLCTCEPSCAGRQCGDDGCGGSCGTCSPSSSYACNSAGQCEAISTGVNTGKLCDASSPCGGTTDTCLLFNSTDTVGMCLGTCQTPGNPCTVPNSSVNISYCAFDNGAGQNFCAWFCEVQGQSFNCPNSWDYSCEVVDSSQPDVKVCLPLQ